MSTGTNRITPLSLPAFIFMLASAVTAVDDEGFTPIFDGKSLDGWDGDPTYWRVEDRAITARTAAKPLKTNTFIIWRNGELDDFELKLEYRIVNGNSGIQYRSFEIPKLGKWVVGGYQADFEAGDRFSGILYGERFRGVLGHRGQQTVVGANHKPRVVGSVGDAAELQKHIVKEDWNEYHVIARDYHFQHRINGKLTVDVLDEDHEMRRRGGILALQAHAGPPMTVQFRNIRIKRLKFENTKKVVLVAGVKSHGYGAHEHNAGCLLLKKLLDGAAPQVHSTVYRDGWPKDPTAFDNADAILLFMDGAQRHEVNQRLDEVDALMKKGVGLGCLHFAVEVVKGPVGDHFLDWIGGYFEKDWSVNPHWTVKDPILAAGHPITRGVNPFEADDEWYYHMRFAPGTKGVTPILSAVPGSDTLSHDDGPRSGNPTVRAKVARGEPQVLAWAHERKDGGRGFGYTGAHFHKNWANDDIRKLVLNSLLWIAKAKVPANGVESPTPTQEDLEANQDYPKPK